MKKTSKILMIVVALSLLVFLVVFNELVLKYAYAFYVWYLDLPMHIKYYVAQNGLSSIEKQLCQFTIENGKGYNLTYEQFSVRKCSIENTTVYSKYYNTVTVTDAGTVVYYDIQGNELCTYSTFFSKTYCREELKNWNVNFSDVNCKWENICGTI